MAFAAPVVDELSVRVVVDSRYERFLPKASHPLVHVEHIGRIPGRPNMTLACEWGLSLHLASAKDGEKAQYVLDFGYTPEIINRNFELLDIERPQVLVEALIMEVTVSDDLTSVDLSFQPLSTDADPAPREPVGESFGASAVACNARWACASRAPSAHSDSNAKHHRFDATQRTASANARRRTVCRKRTVRADRPPLPLGRGAR